jgi:thiol:disulfide interchange protein DsbD
MSTVKRFLASLFMIFALVSITIAQPGDSWKSYVTWSFSVKYDSNCEATLSATAKLAKHWHIFSITHDPNKADFIGVPTTLTFSKNSNYELIGGVKESKKPIEFKDEYGVQIYFDGEVTFSQRIKIKTDAEFDINMEYEFQICDENGCLFPPAPDHTYKIKSNTDCGNVKSDDAAASTNVTESKVQEPESPESDSTSTHESSDEKNEVGEYIPIDNSKEDSEKDVSLWIIFFAGFGAGLAALFTPCVFPMIPMTVTFFTKQSGTRAKGIMNALIYGFSIIFIYVSIGLLINLMTSNAAAVYEVSTSATLNLIFFAIFMVFAFSFLGAFEIQLPTSWINKSDAQADKGGLIGIFFMAITLVLVSFSCTGPIVGTALVEAIASGSVIAPAVIMGGFATALALPFTLFAIFPSWLKNLPQSGGWLNSVKVVLGLLEIALAMKFLSMVDLAYHWDFLTREIFVAIWFVVFVIIGVYLLGKIRFSHDSPIEKLSVTRFMFAFLSLTFAVYLLPGMWGAPLSMIDGVAPPRTHSEDNFRFVKGNPEFETTDLFTEYRQYMHEVGDGSVLVFHDLDKAKEYAKKVDKPVLLDFTGHSCANCRKMESTVWTTDKVRPVLQNEMVIASLYCDDREKLPESEHVFSEYIDGTIKTVGNKWSDFQIRKYGQISQPLYVMTHWDGTDLSAPVGYEPNITGYLDFLRKGIDNYKAYQKTLEK